MPMSERLTLPVLPLREVVLFPGVSTRVGAGRPATLRAIEAALKSDSRLIFAVAQRENVDTVSPDVLYTTGTIAKISQIQRGLGGVQLLLHGERRATALHYTDNGRYLEAVRSEEHTSELQSRLHLVCRLLLEKKKNTRTAKHSEQTTRCKWT